MPTLRFDDRVAIVTGAGSSPGLGHSYAVLLAQLGAKVLVNDVSPADSDGSSPSARVVEEIVAAGGTAIADNSDVSDPDAARSAVAKAMDTWGRVDILVNNAGINIPATFSEITDRDIRRIIDVHLFGHVWMTRAVWEPMKAAGYGRILNTASSVMLGLANEVLYGAAKGGIFSLTRGLAIEGWEHGIRVNTISPGAGTAGTLALAPDNEWMKEVFLPNFSPDLVAPTAAYLVHEDCPVTAGWFSSAGGHVTEGFFSETSGADGLGNSLDQFAERFEQVRDRTGSVESLDPIEANKQNMFEPKPYTP